MSLVKKLWCAIDEVLSVRQVSRALGFLIVLVAFIGQEWKREDCPRITESSCVLGPVAGTVKIYLSIC